MLSVHSRIDNSLHLYRRSESYGACVWMEVKSKLKKSWSVDEERGEPPRASLFWVNNPLNVSVNVMEAQMGWFMFIDVLMDKIWLTCSLTFYTIFWTSAEVHIWIECVKLQVST